MPLTGFGCNRLEDILPPGLIHDSWRLARSPALSEESQRFIRFRNLAIIVLGSLIPETDTDLAGGLNQLMIRIDEFQAINSVSNWYI